ncbi:MAG: aldehyde dehydrogenase (NADP(+)) [Roseibium sp.]|nr:aldehyde dehydrogenase (NADP(+)) [Roseibium sp.]
MLFGKNLINGGWAASVETRASADLDDVEFAQASAQQVDDACAAARSCFRAYSGTDRSARAAFLRTIAAEIDALGDEITVTAQKETGLPEARLVGERGRTTGQLRMFADLIESNDYLDVRIDEAQPDRTPLPRPDLRLTHRAIGPVVVFGASNFPLAFSTAGGDTASALAAGCPVIVKGHEAHAGTAELVAQAILAAIDTCGMPKAVFQMLQGPGRIVGSALVNHPEIRAVGFTGSTAGGRALYDQCHGRPAPIPFYGELGSVNPVFCLPAAMNARAAEIGAGWAASLTMGAGQFCTNPGVLLAVKGAEFDALQETAVEALNRADEQKMLTDAICRSYGAGVDALRSHSDEMTEGRRSQTPRNAMPAAFKTDADTWLSNRALHDEVFGAAGIFVECADIDQMLAVAEDLDGQLTATLQMDDADIDTAREFVPILEEKAGRLLCNGFPTGVEVCSAMMHGGPYPASTDVRATSVGTLAIARWLRPVCYQNFPTQLQHPELRD